MVIQLLVATSNAGKLREVREILAPIGFELLSLEEVALPSPDENGATFHDNAAAKATECALKSGLWTLGDDSGLCVDALGGGPGVRSARYAATDAERRAKLRGGNGFGYDPLFVPLESPGRTLAELETAQKNELSHRGRALARLRPLLERLARDGAL